MLRLLLPATASLLIAAAPAAGAAPRASAAAKRHAESALHEAAGLRDGHGVRTGRELTGALRELALSVRHLRGEERERAVALLARPTDTPATDPDAFDPTLTAQKVCSASFCVHFVLSGTDVASAANAATVLDEAEKVRAFENGTLGWRSPPSDAPLGGDSRVDIYLKELSAQRLFGFAATDLEQDEQAQHSYLVIDNDFDPAQYNGEPADKSLRLTLAHEYGHVLQYGYDVTADNWHYEASSTWLEHRYDASLSDWLRFVRDSTTGAGWRSLTEVPLTGFDDARDQPRNAKPYGSAVWNHFLSGRYGARGDELQRTVWEVSDGLSAPSTRAYDTAIKAVGGPGLAGDFAAFSAATAEWRVEELGFALPTQLPDVERRGTLRADGTGISSRMDHLTFALYDVPATSAARIRLVATFPEGTRGAIALVGRDGSPTAGPVTTRLTELPSGGVGGVTLEQPRSFTDSGGRITAVLVNADATQRGFGQNDWSWTRDNEAVAAAVTTDLRAPAVESRSPAPNARRVATGTDVRVTFSKRVSGVSGRSFSLRAPNGHAVPAAVSYSNSSRTAILVPSRPLADTTRYTVRLTGAIIDGSATPLDRTEWTFRTVRHRPAAAFRVLSADGGGVSFVLRSRDRDRLRWTAQVLADGRKLAGAGGALRSRASRTIRMPTRGARRARLVVKLTDPQANTRRIVRTLRIRG